MRPGRKKGPPVSRVCIVLGIILVLLVVYTLVLKNYYTRTQKLAPVDDRLVGLTKELQSLQHKRDQWPILEYGFQQEIKQLNKNIEKQNNFLLKLSDDLNSGRIKDPKEIIEKFLFPPKDISTLPKLDFGSERIAVIIFTYMRPAALKRCLNSIFNYYPVNGSIDIIISQDQDDKDVKQVIDQFKITYPQITHIQHLERRRPVLRFEKESPGYYYIAQHYQFALSYVFDQKKYPFAIVLEEDIEIAPDFFDYFLNTRHVFALDSSIFTISAFNDNGRGKLYTDPRELYRTDVFPGLGWLLPIQLWKELSPKWPIAYWDDWMREQAQTKGRSSIYPAISRSYTFGHGDHATSKDQFFSKYLQPIVLNNEKVDWSSVDLSYITKEIYERKFISTIRHCLFISVQEIENYEFQSLYVQYSDFEEEANWFGLMPDFKDGVPRTSYKGIVQFSFKNNKIYLGPNSPRSLDP